MGRRPPTDHPATAPRIEPTHQLELVIAERITLADAAEAHALLERGGHTGKVVLTTDADQHA